MKIYIVLVYFTGSEKLNINYIKSFKNFEEAENYFNSLSYRCEIITNELIQVKLLITFECLPFGGNFKTEDKKIVTNIKQAEIFRK